jgi:hypothetical protein
MNFVAAAAVLLLHFLLVLVELVVLGAVELGEQAVAVLEHQEQQTLAAVAVVLLTNPLRHKLVQEALVL